MANLSITEKRQLDRVVQMRSGYMLNFSDRTFREFVADSTGRDAYDERYNHASGSKANRLRGFWTEENNRVVGKLLGDMLDYAESECGAPAEDKDMQACRRTVARLLQDSPVPEIDALSAISDERRLRNRRQGHPRGHREERTRSRARPAAHVRHQVHALAM